MSGDPKQRSDAKFWIKVQTFSDTNLSVIKLLDAEDDRVIMEGIINYVDLEDIRVFFTSYSTIEFWVEKVNKSYWERDKE